MVCFVYITTFQQLPIRRAAVLCPAKNHKFSERDSSFTQNLPFVCCFYSTTQTLLIIKNLKKAGVNLKHQTHLSHKRCIFMQSICVSP